MTRIAAGKASGSASLRRLRRLKGYCESEARNVVAVGLMMR